MDPLPQELMTPDEAAKWFRRSPSWIRRQEELERVNGPNGQPLFHVNVCRAYLLGKMCNLAGVALRRVQIRAMAAACGLPMEIAEMLLATPRSSATMGAAVSVRPVSIPAGRRQVRP